MIDAAGAPKPEAPEDGVRLLVDADACPVKEEAIRVAERHRVPVVFVSNSGLRPRNHPLVRSVMVAEGPDAADDWIAERAGPADIVVTADIPLAKRCLDGGARVLGPDGRPFTEAGIGMALGMRDLNAHLRETEGLAGGGRAFRKQDRSAFLNALENAVQSAFREARARSA